MHISCSFSSRLDTPDHIVLAEELGYERAWCTDAPALFSDIWVTMARAAERTARIGLGTAVIVPGYRHVMTTAAAIATLEALAPGRLVIGIGNGLGQMSMGRTPTRIDDLAEYVRALRGLLRGEDVEYEGSVMRMMHDVEDAAPRPIDIPIVLGAEGPRGLAVARELCDGVVSLLGARPGQEWAAVVIRGTVLAEDVPRDNDRIMAQAGPGAAIPYHVTYASAGAAVDQLPGGRQYREAIEKHPPSSRHLAVWERHLTGVTPEEALVLTPEIVEQLTFTGRPDELRRRLAELEQAGATEVIYHLAGPDIPGDLRAFAEVAIKN